MGVAKLSEDHGPPASPATAMGWEGNLIRKRKTSPGEAAQGEELEASAKLDEVTEKDKEDVTWGRTPSGIGRSKIHSQHNLKLNVDVILGLTFIYFSQCFEFLKPTLSFTLSSTPSTVPLSRDSPLRL